MTLTVRLFPCRSDNYGFLVRDDATGKVATIDTPDAQAILDDLEASGWGRLDMVINTHWHPDHTEGNARLKAETGCHIVGPQEVSRVAPLDQAVCGGDHILLGQTRFEVQDAPGHTLGHIVLHDVADKLAFMGDVVFPLGCGRLFEGTPEQMWDSLSAIMQWPDETVLYSAHEYAASNARFALSLSDDPALKAHCDGVFAKREAGVPTVPTTLATEKAFNPFLTASGADQFAQRRAAKDSFAG